ncbi:MAG: OmpH family outer membrane protein [Smithella sp.]
MKKSIYLITIIVLLIFTWSAGALAADQIGIIDMREIMQDSIAGQKASDDFNKIYEKKHEEIQSAEAEIKKMKDELDKQSELMTPDKLNEKESAYEKKVRDYHFLVEDADEEMKKRDHEITQKLTMEILKIVRAVAKKEKYAFVIDAANLPVTYYAKENDFSKKVIEELNKMK